MNESRQNVNESCDIVNESYERMSHMRVKLGLEETSYRHVASCCVLRTRLQCLKDTTSMS